MAGKDGGERPKRVLVVDDNLQTTRFLVEALEDEEYQVDHATNGMEALARCVATPPDVILLDLLLPAMDGWEFLEALRDKVTVPPPVIVMTANRSAWNHASDARAAAYLAKPFELDDLLGTLRRLLAKNGPADQPVHAGDPARS